MGKHSRIKQAKLDARKSTPQLPTAESGAASASTRPPRHPPSAVIAAAHLQQSTLPNIAPARPQGPFFRSPVGHGSMGSSDLRQVLCHPLLLSHSERLQLIQRGFALLSCVGWTDEYKEVVRRSVDVYGIIRDKEGFSGVLFEKGAGYYEQNALGALMFSIDAIDNVNDHLAVEKHLSPQKLNGMLTDFFPEMFVDTFNFLRAKNVDITALMPGCTTRAA